MKVLVVSESADRTALAKGVAAAGREVGARFVALALPVRVGEALPDDWRGTGRKLGATRARRYASAKDDGVCMLRGHWVSP